jgi:PTS system nitrogen regulatory IIA component
MHITIDAQHVGPLRQALVRDCAGLSWSICVAVLPGGERMRLSLTLPRIAVSEALAHISNLAPGAEVRQFVEVPDRPSGAWLDMIQSSQARPGPRSRESQPMTIGSILREEDVLLGFDAADQPALFRRLGTFAAERYGLEAEAVTAGLTARELLGSTGLGQGVAVPHGRISGVPREFAIYVRPIVPIPFDAPDGNLVIDLVCLLLPDWNNSGHLHLLASVAQCFCDQRFRLLLRNCTEARSICGRFSCYSP